MELPLCRIHETSRGPDHHIISGARDPIYISGVETACNSGQSACTAASRGDHAQHNMQSSLITHIAVAHAPAQSRSLCITLASPFPMSQQQVVAYHIRMKSVLKMARGLCPPKHQKKLITHHNSGSTAEKVQHVWQYIPI